MVYIFSVLQSNTLVYLTSENIAGKISFVNAKLSLKDNLYITHCQTEGKNMSVSRIV